MHLHSDYSVDADDTINDMCQKAIDLGLKGICFTEHLDMNPKDPAYDYFELNSYLQALTKAKTDFENELLVLGGVEFNKPNCYPEKLKEVISSKFDVILASIHWMDEMMFGSGDLVESYATAKIFNKYYKLMLEMVKYGDFDILAHMDFPKRYVAGKVDITDNFEKIKEILKVIIQKDIVLEINTSSIRKGIKDCMPGREILSLYYDLGGNKVTLASDAHRVSEIAADFDFALEIIDKFDLTAGYFQSRNFKKLN